MSIVYELDTDVRLMPELDDSANCGRTSFGIVKYSICDDSYHETDEAYHLLLEKATSALQELFAQLSPEWRLGLVISLYLGESFDEVSRVRKYQKVWKRFRIEKTPEYWQVADFGKDIVTQTADGTRAIGVMLTNPSFLKEVLRYFGTRCSFVTVFMTNSSDALEEEFACKLGALFGSKSLDSWIRFFINRGDIPIHLEEYGGITPALEVSAFWRKGLIEEPDVEELARMGEEREA